MIITIDGPAASGKSTVANLLAQRLNYCYLNSGMLYRAVAYCLLNKGIQLDLLANCSQEEYMHCINSLSYAYDKTTGKVSIALKNTEITSLLKTPLIDRAASKVGENLSVRHYLSALQRAYMHENLIAEGRDAGTEVFPEAAIKFFLTAKVEVRAQRWIKDQMKKGIVVSLEDAVHGIMERDNRDSNRENAPLYVGKDDIVVDNSDLSLEQTLELLFALVQQKKGRQTPSLK